MLCKRLVTPALVGSVLLKSLLETRLQSESFDTLDDFLGFWVQKLQSKAMVLNRGYEEPKQGVRSTKVFRDTRSGNLNQILLNIHRDFL